jgi:hypothetical protein
MPSDMRFTQAQKRDLLRMSGAAVVSTIFFGVPMFIGRPDATRVQTVASQDQQAPVTVAPSQPLTVAPTVVVVVSDAVAQTTTPMLEALPAAAPRVPATPPRRHTLVATGSERQRPDGTASSVEPLAKRIGRLLAGTGRYEVKPFPTVSTSGS